MVSAITILQPDTVALIRNIKTPSIYHRKVRPLTYISHYKGIEYYILFSYCISVFEGWLTEDQMNVLWSFLKVIMQPISKSEVAQQLLKEDIFSILCDADSSFGPISLLTLSSHTCGHFPE